MRGGALCCFLFGVACGFCLLISVRSFDGRTKRASAASRPGGALVEQSHDTFRGTPFVAPPAERAPAPRPQLQAAPAAAVPQLPPQQSMASQLLAAAAAAIDGKHHGVAAPVAAPRDAHAENADLKQQERQLQQQLEAVRARREKLKAGTVREEMVRARGPPAGLHDAPASGARPEKLSTVLVRDTVEFSKERAEAVATNGQLLLTFTNKIRLDFATTWVWHVRRLKMTNWLVGATDAEALVALRAAKTPCFDMKTELPLGEWPWGSPSFKALGPHKIELIYKAIVWGLEVIITDVDALVLREPFAYMARWPDAGFLTTTDHLGNTTADEGLEDHRGIHSAFNIGCARARAIRARAIPAQFVRDF